MSADAVRTATVIMTEVVGTSVRALIHAIIMVALCIMAVNINAIPRIDSDSEPIVTAW